MIVDASSGSGKKDRVEEFVYSLRLRAETREEGEALAALNKAIADGRIPSWKLAEWAVSAVHEERDLIE